MAGVFGELDEAGSLILVTCTGDAHELDQCAGALQAMTPAFAPTQDPDVYAVPLSWTVVTQLAHAFTGAPQWDGRPGLRWVPGPRLGQWLLTEIIRRSCEGDFTGQRPKREPMLHQHAGGVAVGMNGRFLFADDMGPQPVGTPVLLTSGTWTELGKLQPGDAVYGQHGFAARVAEVKFLGRQPVYRVTFSDRTSTLATARHLWRVYTPNHRRRGHTRLGEAGYVRSTQQLADAGLRGPHGNRKFFLPQQPALAYGRDARWFELDPYSYGVLLGDGCLTGPGARLSCPDEDILYRVQEAVLEGTMTTSRQERYPGHCAGVAFHQNGRLGDLLESLGARHLAAGKAVHPSYLNGDARVRRELLRGLLDTDGSVTGSGAAIEFSSASAQLASDVAFLARSLGAVATESAPQPAHYVLSGERVPCQDKHRVLLRFPAGGPNPFWCRRKAAAWLDAAFSVQRKEPPRGFESVEPEGEAEVCCIRLEGEGHGHVYLTDRTLIPTHNTGKGGSYLMGLAELEARGRDPWPATVVIPAGVVDTFLEEIAEWYPDWHAVAYRGTGRLRYLRSNARILVMGYETMRSDTGDARKPGPLLKRLKAGTVIYDECHCLCVASHTLIPVPGGLKPVCEVREGDLVRGTDPQTGVLTWTRVNKVSRSALRPTIRFRGLDLTPGHPVWISDAGYSDTYYATAYGEVVQLRPLRELVHVPALPEQAGAEVLLPRVPSGWTVTPAGDGTSNWSMRALRRRVHSLAEREPEVLLPWLCLDGDDAGEEARDGSGADPGTAPGKHGQGSPVPGAARVPAVRQEPVQRTGLSSAPHEGPCNSGCGWVADAAGRQRHGAYYPAGTALEAARRGVHPGVLRRAGEEGAGLPDELQAGPGAPATEAGRGAGRLEPRHSGGQGTGRQAEREAGFTWLDDAAVPERDSPERSLWNLSTDTGNYVANAVLVHNCNFDSLQSRKARVLAAHVPNVMAGSGTPITKNGAGFWPVLNAMYPESYPARERFKKRYFLVKGRAAYGNGDADIAGLDPLREPEFRVAMQGVYRRVAKEDVLDLPPKTYSTRYVEIPAAWRAAYEQMEEDMLAELPDSMTPLEANAAIVKMTRLRQLACSACDVQVTRETEANARSPRYGEEVEHVKVTLREPCWKGAELVDILRELHQAEGEHDERGGQHGHTVGSRPVIAFAESAQLVRLAGAMAGRKGYAVGYIDGSVSHPDRKEVRLAFQAGKLDLLCVTTGTGGAGLNLTAADTVVFLARPWGYVPAVQAEDRAYRRGQDKPVQVIDIVAKDTVESRVRALLRGKAANLAELVQDRRIVEGFLGGR